MKFFITALVLMMSLSACSTDDEPVVATGDVVVEDVQVDTTDATDVVEDTVDSTGDVTTVEEGD
tara:strand:+ start:220 stop:411 length:192 start_codon:yes stop_codon:yes gene_type:complete